jgi:metal-responsive CopG/Arc/MetJ family transcriptional regulator
MLVKVNVSLEEKLWKKIDALAKRWKVSRSKACRQIFDVGIIQFRKKMGVELLGDAVK